VLSDSLPRRRLLLLLATVPATAWLVPRTVRHALAAPDAEAARQMVNDVGAQVIAILSDRKLSDQDKFDRLVALLDGPIDLDLVGRLILGRHWRTASPEQRKEFLALFRAYVLDNLASRLHLYRGQDFEIVSAKPVGKRDILVYTKIASAGEAPLAVDWRIRELKDGRLVAIDMIVEGVSLVVSQRSEFASVIERQGFDGLLAQLRQRLDQPA